jgi:hypothetical protein
VVPALRPVLEYEVAVAPAVPIVVHGPLELVARWMLYPD